jgi:1-phosphofructokinase
MSPAIDATVTLPRAPRGDGEIFKDVADEENVGGKTVNVARWLSLRGADVACGGLLGEENDRPFAKELAKYGIDDMFVRVSGSTRRNEMIVWPGGSVKLNRAAFPGLGGGTTEAIADLEERVLSKSPRDSGVAILSGSLPPAIPKDFYARAVAAFKARGFKTVLDASGEAMRLGLEARPDLIKPNAEECEPLVGFVPKTKEEFARATDALRETAAHVVISDGGAGAWFDGEFVAAPKVDVVDTTAAGDTLLAEFCFRFFTLGSAPSSLRSVARFAVAAGSAACMMPGGAPPDPELVARLAEGLADHA